MLCCFSQIARFKYPNAGPRTFAAMVVSSPSMNLCDDVLPSKVFPVRVMVVVTGFLDDLVSMIPPTVHWSRVSMTPTFCNRMSSACCMLWNSSLPSVLSSNSLISWSDIAFAFSGVYPSRCAMSSLMVPLYSSQFSIPTPQKISTFSTLMKDWDARTAAAESNPGVAPVPERYVDLDFLKSSSLVNIICIACVRFSGSENAPSNPFSTNLVAMLGMKSFGRLGNVIRIPSMFFDALMISPMVSSDAFPISVIDCCGERL